MLAYSGVGGGAGCPGGKGAPVGGGTAIFSVTVLRGILREIKVNKSDVHIKIIANVVVTFLKKTLPLVPPKIVSPVPPPPNRLDRLAPLPACKRTIKIKQTQAIT